MNKPAPLKVYGHVDLLCVLLDRIVALQPMQSEHLIQLGDIVVRRPESARVA